ncbi:unnamed protein product [Effrenium voratum]|nr:unnamed protein product [Effrenium voratum]
MHGPLGTSKTASVSLCHLDELHDLGVNLARQGRLAEAESALHQAWQGRSGRLGADHPMTHNSLRECAELRRRRGDEGTCETLLRQSRCHGLHQRHPEMGNGLLPTTQHHTKVTPKNPRALQHSEFPTRNPGPCRFDEQTLRRSFSMSEIRKSPQTPQTTIKLLLGAVPES